MRKKKKNELLEMINVIYTQSKNCKLENKVFIEVKKELAALSKFLKLNREQSFLFANIITNNLGNSAPDLNDLGRYLDVTPVQLAMYIEDLELMTERGYLSARSTSRRDNDLISSKSYTVTQEVMIAILRNEPLPDLKKSDINSTLEVLGELYELIDQRCDVEISSLEFRKRFNQTLTKYKQHSFIKVLSELDLSLNERSVYVYVIWKTIMGNRSVDIESVSRGLFGTPSSMVHFLQKTKDGRNNLISFHLLQSKEARFLNDIELSLTEKTLQFLLDDGIQIKLEVSKREGLIEPEKIGERPLYYNPKEAIQMESVRSLIEEKNYQQMVDRLKSKSLPLSLNILLYGAPGTGKTESVLQIAKATGREIIKVEISQMKSMWFGESEKIIKKVFTDYAEYSALSKITPILLFNEADAILGTRNSFSGGNTRQTENAIQNILLEELENFKGIFIATTNLVTNLDKAFERRFLFKVRFEKPIPEIRSKIWMNRIPTLKEEDATDLARQFELSGGQIENIVRKTEIEHILNGTIPDLNSLIQFCREENIQGTHSSKRIGF